jgi:hypothetical protein
MPIHRNNVFKNTVLMNESGWVHSDPETTKWLNYITGKGKLDLQTRQILALQMSILEFKHEYLFTDSKKLHGYSPEETYRYFLENVVKDSLPYNSDVYNFVWKKEKEAGAPKIRFVLGEAFTDRRPYQERYGFLNNTAYINFFNYAIFESVRADFAGVYSFLAEIAHADQYYNHPVHSLLQLSWSGYRTTVSWVFNKKTWRETYQETYTEHESIEYDAHAIRQVALEKELESVFHKYTQTHP